MENIAKKLQLAAASPNATVYYGNIKNHPDVKKVLEMLKELKIDEFFK